MKSLLNAFSKFIKESTDIELVEQTQITNRLRQLLDADPEKLIMRKALEYYARDHNWPYDMHSPDGIGVIGMNADEATDVARQALIDAENSQPDAILAGFRSEVFTPLESELHTIIQPIPITPETKIHV